MKISKNIWLLPFLFITVHILYIGCCKCVTDLKGKPYRQVTTTRIVEYTSGTRYSNDTVFVKDSLLTQIYFNYEYIASIRANPFNPFVGTAMATSCNCIYLKDSGYKAPLDSIKIFSNHAFANRPAGANLITLFTGSIPSYSNNINYQNLPVSVMLDSLNAKKDYSSILLKLKISDPGLKDHLFKYIFYIKGRVIESTNKKPLFWE